MSMELSTDDYIAIQQLYAQNTTAYDLGDLDGWVGTWTADGVLNGLHRQSRGHSAIREYGAAAMANPENKGYHYNTNFRIEPSDVGARCTCYLLHMRLVDSVATIGHYRDELVKQDGRWLFTARTLHLP